MKDLIQKLRLKYVILVSGLLLGVIYSFKPSNSKKMYKNVSNDISGESIFKGVFFGDPAVASFFPNYVYKEKSKSNELIINELVSEIAKYNPQYFAEFKFNLESGNPLKVEEALNSGSKLIVSAIKRDKKNFLDQKIFAYQDGPTIMAVEGAIITRLRTADIVDSFGRSNLENEQFVNSIAETLKK